MHSGTKQQIQMLVRLQEINTELKRIEKIIAEVPARQAFLESRLSEFKLGLDQKTTTLEDIQKKYRTYEFDTQSNVSMIDKSLEKLRSVKNNKEYQSILKEIEDLKAKNSELEDEMIEFLDRMDDADQDLKRTQREYVQLNAQIAREKEQIDREALEAQKQLGSLKADRDTFAESIQSDMLMTFQKVQKHNATAIVPVVDAVCQGCHLNIPPQMYNELQIGENLTFCPHCQRIIYWRKPD